MLYEIGLLLVAVAVLMVHRCVDAFVPKLIPSQVVAVQQKSGTSSSRRETSTKSRRSAASDALIPSQVLFDGRIRLSLQSSTTPTNNESPKSTESSDEEEEDDDNDDALVQVHRRSSIRSKRRSRRPKKRSQLTARKHKGFAFPSTGNVPDAFWRAVPMEHLRLHPLFEELGPPESIRHLSSLEDVNRFQQGSWQWEALHRGRCTTSQAVAALGFLEPTAAEVLNIPIGWRRGGMGAFQRLREPALRTLEQMNSILCNNEDGTVPKETTTPAIDQVQQDNTLWTTTSNSHHTHNYTHVMDEEERSERKKYMRRLGNGDNMDSQVRLLWGNTQEATSLLTALNFFNKQQNESGPITLREAGMCGAGLALNCSEAESSLMVGATPDGIIEHADGSIEALEVKNHCPFYSNRHRKRHGGHIKRFSVSSRPILDSTRNGFVFPQYVPQLQMEMLCLGPKCRSAVMVRQTATQGAIVIRMQRDDEWISEMVYWLHRFQIDFVEADTRPPKDFFWNASDPALQSRYRRFVNRTAELKNTARLVAEVPQATIQRVAKEQSMFLD